MVTSAGSRSLVQRCKSAHTVHQCVVLHCWVGGRHLSEAPRVSAAQFAEMYRAASKKVKALEAKNQTTRLVL